MKTWQIARRLVYQNRWLYLLLVLWPMGMAATLLLPPGQPDPHDLLAVLHQECLYGLALVAFTAGAQLGNEQRSRRIVGVLSRAVSRPAYLFALLCAAWIPLALYTASFLLGGKFLSARFGPIQEFWGALWSMALAELVWGLWVAATSLFFASWLPAVLASTATLALVGATALLGRLPVSSGAVRLLGTFADGSLAEEAGMIRHVGDFLSVLVTTAVFFAVATVIFVYRDLKLTDD